MNEVAEELHRRQSNKEKLLAYLQKHGEATNAQLIHIAGFRFSARLEELRKDGYEIKTIKGKGGIYTYKYVAGKGEEDANN